MRLPVGIHYHQERFHEAEPDDSWLPAVGAAGWIVVGQDYSYHKRETEAAALRLYNMGCFYIWGAQARRWDTMRLFARAYDRIVLAAETSTRPFLFFVQRDGRLAAVNL
jgi:hypothetical protein